MNSSSFVLLVVLFAGATQINGSSPNVRTDVKGRPLTPEEGCGFSKVPHKRIVGGGPAKDGNK